MPIIRYDPFRPFFDGDASKKTNALMSCFRGDDGNKQLWQPSGFQVQEDEKNYSISVDVPGVRAEDMKMQLVDNNQALSLSGGRKFHNGETVEETKFERRFNVGTEVDVEKINAALSNGVLTITVPKKDPKKESSRLIAINSGATME